MPALIPSPAVQVYPSREDFRDLARDFTVVPVVHEVLADHLTPVVAYATVGGTYLLESVVGGEKWARYSFVGLEPDLMVRASGTRLSITDASDGRTTDRELPDPWVGFRALMARHRPADVPELGLPRFWGGAVGYVSYDAVRRFEPTVGAGPRGEGEEVPELSFAIGGTVLVFDNLKQTLRVVVAARIDDPAQADAAYARALERIERVAAKLATPATLRAMRPPSATPVETLPPSSFERAAYCDAVRRAQEHIRAGDIFQVVLSQRFQVPGGGADAFDVYRAMRAINPSPYMFFLRFPEARIAGASPETLVRVDHGVAEVRPIAGTRRRDADPEKDRAIEAELLADPKERAEHVMLVDLGRNDLGRICVPGTVKLTERMAVERYSHVMHLVSNVSGKLAEGRDALDVLRATFPAGTLSGAPKVRAMQIIDTLEPVRRGIYGGAVGYLGFGGNLDVAIAIRTVVERNGNYLLQAGAGIVEASNPDAEYDETVHKARAALAALAAAR